MLTALNSCYQIPFGNTIPFSYVPNEGIGNEMRRTGIGNEMRRTGIGNEMETKSIGNEIGIGLDPN